MEFNIALNTIVYITIFIFPGIIFRKFYYIREYSKEFDKGNLFERFIWTIFASVMILISSFLIYTFIVDIWRKEPLPYLSYDSIKSIHQEISNNSLPENIENKDTYRDFSLLMLSIYLLSGIMGFVWYLLTKSPILKRMGLFKKMNYWEDLVKGVHYKNEDDTLMHSYTLVDVLIDTGTNNKLYSGELKDYYINHIDNQLQTIVLSQVQRYKKEEQKQENGEFPCVITIKKDIPGHYFIIEKNKILNLNFTYVYQKKDQSTIYGYIYNFIRIISIGLFISLITSLFFNTIHAYTYNILRIITYTIFGSILILIINKFLKIAISWQWSSWKREYSWILIISIIPFLWIFNILDWKIIFSIEILSILFFSFFVKK